MLILKKCRLLMFKLFNINTSKQFYLWLLLRTFLIGFFCTIKPNLSVDIIENVYWGQELQWGYFKHPPLFAWISFAWIKIVGQTLYPTLFAVTTSISIFASYKITKIYLPKPLSITSALLLEGVLFYNFSACNFNANSILLVLWPACAYFLLCGIRSACTKVKLLHWSLFGACAALSMLSKYYSGIFLLSCFVTTLITPQARNLYKTIYPYLAFTVFCIILTPHVIWLFKYNFIPLTYITNQVNIAHQRWFFNTNNALITRLLFTIELLLLTATISSGLIVATIIIIKKTTLDISRNTLYKISDLICLTITPMICVVVLIICNIRIDYKWLVPHFFAIPTIILYITHKDIKQLLFQKLYNILIYLFIITSILHIFLYSLVANNGYNNKAIANFADTLWTQNTHSKLHYICGENRVAGSIVTFAPQKSDMHFIPECNLNYAPWINQNSFNKYGILIAYAPDQYPDYISNNMSTMYNTFQTCGYYAQTFVVRRLLKSHTQIVNFIICTNKA